MWLIKKQLPTYSTRRLTAADPIEVSEMQGRILLATRRYEKAPDVSVASTPEPAPVSPVVARVSAPNAEDDPALERLRQDAEALGVVVDKRWGVRRLQTEIEAKRAS